MLLWFINPTIFMKAGTSYGFNFSCMLITIQYNNVASRLLMPPVYDDGRNLVTL